MFRCRGNRGSERRIFEPERIWGESPTLREPPIAHRDHMHNNTSDPGSRNQRIEELEGLLVETERQLIDLHRGGELGEETAVAPLPPPPVPAEPPPPRPNPSIHDQPSAPNPGPAPTVPRSAARTHKKTFGDFGAAEMWLRIGGIAMVVASAIFFVSTAINRGWIGPSAQLALATLTSLGFIALSFRFASERRPWTVATAIGGAASLFATGVVGFVGLDLLSLPVATGWFVASMLAFIALALVHNAQSLVVASVPATLIGFVLIGVDNGLAPSGVALLASGYLLAVTLACHERGWMMARTLGVSLGAGAGGLAVLLSMADNASSTAVLVSTAAVVIAIAAAVLSQSREFARFETSVTDGPTTTPIEALFEARVTALAIPWTSLLAALAIRHLEITDIDFAWTAILVAIVLAVVVAVAPRAFPLTMQLLHGVAALATVTVGLVTLLEGPVLLVAMLGQTIAAAILALRFKSTEMIIAVTTLATAVLVVTVGLLVHGTFVDGFDVAESASVALVVVSVGVASWFLHENEVFVDSWVAPWVLTLGWASATFRDVPQGQMAVTLIWALTGALMVILGARIHRRHLVGAGLLTLAVTAGKLVFVDLATVDVLWRAGLFFVVGAVFLRLGFVLPGLLTEDRSSSDDHAEQADEATKSASVGIG